MAKKIPKGKKTSQRFDIHKNPKAIAGIAVIFALLLVVGILVFNNNKDATAGVTSTKDLAKSTINENNTKDTKAEAVASAAEGTAPAEANGTTSGTKKSTTAKTSTTQSGSSSGGSTTTTTTSPTSTPDPFSVSSGIYSSVDNGYTSIGCNETTRFTFTAYIEANRAGTATYHWERSDGAMSSDRQAVFSGAGTVEVTNTWDLSSGGTTEVYDLYGWQKVIVTSPNDSMSKASDADFTLSVSCT